MIGAYIGKKGGVHPYVRNFGYSYFLVHMKWKGVL